MKITQKDADKLAEFYDKLLWYENFSRKLPPEIISCETDGLACEVLYVSGWVDGALYRLPNEQQAC